MSAPTKAFVWAAGLGTRLRPYTFGTPKPLLEVGGRPILEYVLRFLAHAGIAEVTVNTWHLAEQFERVPEIAAGFGLDVALSRQPDRFEHGGDLAFAQDFLAGLGDDEPFLGLNGDTLFRLDPALLREAAARVGPDAPVLLFTQPTDANPLRVRDGRLVGIGSVAYDVAEATGRADDFGLKVFHASVRRFLAEPGQTDSFHGHAGLAGRVAAAGGRVLVQPVEAFERVEIGTVEDYEGCGANAALQALVRRLSALP